MDRNVDLLSECEQTDIVLRIRADLSHTNKVDSVFLCVQASWEVVSIPLVVAVVETEILQKKIC